MWLKIRAKSYFVRRFNKFGPLDQTRFEAHWFWFHVAYHFIFWFFYLFIMFWVTQLGSRHIFFIHSYILSFSCCFFYHLKKQNKKKTTKKQQKKNKKKNKTKQRNKQNSKTPMPGCKSWRKKFEHCIRQQGQHLWVACGT